ncbi:MAG: GntR family transcriptional regulator, partial [Candidatus Scalindua sp.]|nr:GntR family transcriptional regulator [Candidatus Scalindua sp.]
DDITDTILNVLKEQGGFISVTDKSSPETINKLFGVSKKTYKKAIGAIYRKRLITMESDGIRLISK